MMQTATKLATVVCAVFVLQCALCLVSSAETDNYRVKKLDSDNEIAFASSTKEKPPKGRISCVKGCLCTDSKACTTSFISEHILSCRTNTDCWLEKLKQKLKNQPKITATCLKNCFLRSGGSAVSPRVATVSVFVILSLFRLIY